jgi:aminoglycoside 6'-N-acetyltransferase I
MSHHSPPLSNPAPGPVEVRRAAAPDRPEWLRMRRVLWPECSPTEHQGEIAGYLEADAQAAFVAVRPGGLCGFVEAALRPWAEGCVTRPVGYIEGWFVDPEFRRQGIGGWLIAAAEQWAREQGCIEMASDVEIGNTMSLDAHRALGYEETSRLIHLRKRLASGPASE